MGADRQIRDEAGGYAELLDQVSRTSARARVVSLLDELQLRPTPGFTIADVTPDALSADAVLRGAIVMHLDLVFRSSVSRAEVAFTTERGVVKVAMHPDLDGFPVAVVLASATERLSESRDQLFAEPEREFPDADIVMPYALAASPRGLGAGRELLAELVRRCGAAAKPPRITTFSPLTGMRAHVMRCVDDPSEWARVLERNSEVDRKQLRGQLLALLAFERLPEEIPDPARSWLRREATDFARSQHYNVGKFHRGMGAALAGILEDADPADNDALWWRAWFDYGRADPSFGR